MVKKLDLSKVKRYFFEKGERVGLVVCTGLMVAIVGYSLHSGFSARGTSTGKPFDVAIKDAAQALDRRVAGATFNEETLKKPFNMKDIEWTFVFSNFQFAPFVVLPDKAFTKKLNPHVLSVYGDGEKHWQLDYVRGPALVYELDKQKVSVIAGAGDKGGMPGGANMPANMAIMQKGAGPGTGASNLVQVVRPTRMVVVSGIFPMREQLEVHRTALRYSSAEELLTRREELPKPLGLEVARCEILPGGKAGKWEPLFEYKKGKWTVAPSIRTMMKIMVIDEENPQKLANYIYPGLVTPLPKLAHTDYPKLDLKGIEMKEMAAENNPLGGGNKPMMPGVLMPKGKKLPGAQEQPGMAAGGGGEVQIRSEAITKLSKELQDKFNDKAFVFDPLGQPLIAPADKKTGPMMAPQMAPPGGMPGEMGGGAAAIYGWERILGGAGFGGNAMMPGNKGEEVQADGENPAAAATPTVRVEDGALVRFFDPDVVAGKTYVYTIRVRMANPNAGKKNDVAFQALADQKELEPLPGTAGGGWVLTPPITIPGDYYWYAVDQAPEVKVKGGAHYGIPPSRPETAPVQVQRWVDKVVDQRNGREFTTAEWAIAERLHVRRGEPVGQYDVMVEMPVWRRDLQAFEIGHSAQAAKGRIKPPQPNKEAPIASGIPVDFVSSPPALVVDFEGGKKTSVLIGKDYVSDSSAIDILVLNAEGKLVARNQRTDSDEDTPGGDARQEHFEHWRDRIRALRQPAGGAGVAMPGGPPMPN